MTESGFPPESTINNPSQGFAGFSREEPAEAESTPDAEFDFAVPEESAEESESEQELELESEETEEESVEDVAPKQGRGAEKRIKQLVEQKKRAQAESNELRLLIEQMRKNNEYQERIAKRQDDYLSSQQEQVEKRRQREVLVQQGLDPTDPKSWLLMDQIRENQTLAQKLAALEQGLQARDVERQIERFNHALDRSLESQLSKFDVNSDMFGNMRDLAYSYAAANNVSAEDAAVEVVRRLSGALRPKVTKSVQRSDSAAAHKVIATSGRSGGATKGRGKPKTFEEWLSSDG